MTKRTYPVAGEDAFPDKTSVAGEGARENGATPAAFPHGRGHGFIGREAPTSSSFHRPALDGRTEMCYTNILYYYA